MARPKGKLFALLAIFAAIGIVTATGAFTSVTADRTATVDVAGDDAAILGLTPFHGPNGNGSGTYQTSEGYAKYQNDNILAINLGGYSNGNSENQGINYNATTTFRYVFNITNNGERPINYAIEPIGGNNPGQVNFYNGTTTSGTNVTGATPAEALNVGKTDSISIEIDIKEKNPDDVSSPLINEITIHAQAQNPQ